MSHTTPTTSNTLPTILIITQAARARSGQGAETVSGAQRSKQAAKARDFGEPSTLLREASYLTWTQAPRLYIRPSHGR